MIAAPADREPTLETVSKDGELTMTGLVDARHSGRTFFYFVVSGLTGKVGALGRAVIDDRGIARLAVKLAKGRRVASYGKILGLDATLAYTKTIVFVVG